MRITYSGTLPYHLVLFFFSYNRNARISVLAMLDRYDSRAGAIDKRIHVHRESTFLFWPAHARAWGELLF
jgi:hypothetical protein